MPQALASGSIQRYCTKTLSWKPWANQRNLDICRLGFGVSLFPVIWKDLSECFFEVTFCFWILNIIRCHIIFVYFISFPALYIFKP